ncbi:unnamed protein product [Somion occarium]|uniref:Nephrocystin 3-like N-terminal domain-containing protein n=1 Tax=Somion occarium TaxID=3059160 RepID=A0ABP1DDQ8_9APHY
MDPIGMTVNVISLIQACVVIANYVSEVKDAEADCNKITSELKSTVEILKELDALICRLKKDNSNNRQAYSSALAPLCRDGVVEACQADLNEFVDWLNKQTKKTKGISGKLLWPLKGKQKVEGLLPKLQSQKMLFVLALQIESRHSLADSRDAFEEFVTRQKVRDQESHWLEVMKWLKPVDYDSKHKTVWARRETGTCSWLLDHLQFMNWRQSMSSTMLHLHGIPGSGKSTLVSTVINQLLQPDQLFGPCALAYHYCDFRNEDSRNPAVVLRTLLVQFTKFDPSTDTLDNLARHRNEKLHTPTFLDDIYSLLVPAIRTARYTPVVVVDALDECVDVQALIQVLKCLQNDVAGIRILVSSRSEESIITPLKGHLFIDITQEARSVNSDIALYIDKTFETTSRAGGIPPDLIPDVKQTLLTRASGMFRLVDSQIALLKLSRSRVDVKKALQSLPQDLYEVYDRILLAIEDQGGSDQHIVYRTLRWLFGAADSITLSELNEAMMIKLDPPSLDRDLEILSPSGVVEACGSLVQYNEVGRTVTISHYTVKEYFTSKRQRSQHQEPRLLLDYDWSGSEIAFDLACQSVAYLSVVTLPSSMVTALEDAFNSSHDYILQRSSLLAAALADIEVYLRTNHPLFFHAARHWQRYLFNESNRTPDDVLERAQALLLNRERLTILLVACDKFSTIVSRAGRSDKYEEIPLSSLIYLAIENSPPSFLERMLRTDQDSINSTLHPWTRLYVAVKYRNAYAVQREVQAGVNAAEESAALLEALKPGPDFTKLQYLLRVPMDPSSLYITRPNSERHSILHLAVQRNLHNFLFYPLIKAAGNINLRSDDGATALITWGRDNRDPACLHMASTLVEEGCDSTLRDNNGQTVFWHVLNATDDFISSHPGIIENQILILLQAGCDPRVPISLDPEMTALEKARSLGLVDVVSHLERALSTIILQEQAVPATLSSGQESADIAQNMSGSQIGADSIVKYSALDGQGHLHELEDKPVSAGHQQEGSPQTKADLPPSYIPTGSNGAHIAQSVKWAKMVGVAALGLYVTLKLISLMSNSGKSSLRALK